MSGADRTTRSAGTRGRTVRVLVAVVVVGAATLAVLSALGRSPFGATGTGPAPSVTGLAPASGPTAGGTTVKVTGTRLGGATQVVFGTVAAASFVVHSDVLITAVTPADVPGTLNVRVTTPGGTSPAVAADRFIARPPPPVVTGVSPAWGPPAGGTSVTVTGTHFTGTPKVVFGSTPASSVHVVSDTRLTVVSPAAGIGWTDVRVTTLGGTSAVVSGDRFYVQSGAHPVCGTRSGPPTTTKLLVIYEENHGASAIYGSPDAPTINAYAAECGRALDYQSETHPSLPNYLESTSGVSYASAPWTSDCSPVGTCLTGNENIFDQVGASRWTSYAESMSSNCSQAGTAYAARHNPALYYTDLTAACAVDDVPMGSTTSGAFLADVDAGRLPTFGTVTPNLNDDMHDGTVAEGDTWLAGWLPIITAGPDYRSGDLTIIIVWDEGSGSGTVASTVPMVAISPYVTPGTSSTVPLTHRSLLRAAEDIAGVPELPGVVRAGDLRAAFGF